jgi:LytS/YehU family sensor histidine kinase
MLRYQLYECNTDSISIEKEINYIRNYIALQESRKTDNLEIILKIDNNLEGFCIAPLLFTTFIENAFKYVSHYENKTNRIDISLYRNNSNLIFCSSNTKEELNGHLLPVHKGIGINNVRRRLELLYPGKHELALNSTDNSYEVKLNIHL